MNNHKSEYGVIQTIRFMIRQAVKEAPAVLVWLVVDAILALILQLLELYVTPVLLRDIEEQIALKELVTTILLFSGGILLLTGLKEYINNATYQGKIEIRMSLCKAITAKIGATSYCNLGKKDFQEKRAHEPGNQQQPQCNGNHLDAVKSASVLYVGIFCVPACHEKDECAYSGSHNPCSSSQLSGSTEVCGMAAEQQGRK